MTATVFAAGAEELLSVLVEHSHKKIYYASCFPGKDTALNKPTGCLQD